jgi:nucleoside-diphosphate-sugar epimerase
MKVLVTGAAGYIGSVVVRQLLEQNHQVVGLDSLKWGGDALFDVMLNPNFTFVHGDLRDTQNLDSWVEGVDAIIHLAAIVGDPACSKYSDEAKAVNWDASVNLFNAAENAGVKRFVFASTCSNYGKMADSDSYVVETSELNPVSLYAELKVKFEKYLLEERSDSRMCSTALRFSTVYGFSPRIRFDLTVNEFTREAVLGKHLEVWGPQFWRPYCHVEDLSRSALLVLESEEAKVKSNVFGVGDTEENYQKGQIVKEIAKIVPNVDYAFVDKTEDPRDYRVNFDKIKNELGFTITKTVPDGIREIYKMVESGVLQDTYGQKYRNI